MESFLIHINYLTGLSAPLTAVQSGGGVIGWLAQNWFGILAVVFTFGFMIFVHEMGHFLMAKRVGITVHEFALGFGPKILSFGGNKNRKKGGKNCEESPEDKPDEPVETQYNLRLIPLGGFVSMEGEDEPGNLDDPGNFNNKTIGQRLKVIVAGCVMNYVTGILILLLIGFAWGVAVPKDENPQAAIGQLLDGYPLKEAGFKLGDRILKVDGQEVADFEELSRIVSPIKDSREITLTIERDDEILEQNVAVLYDEETDRGMLGFAPMRRFGFDFKKASPGQVVADSFYTTGRLTIMPFIIVKMLVSKEMTGKQIAKGTAGPIGIGHMLFEVSKEGLPTMLYMCAILSILIGAFNLLPIPALDGSRAVFLILEAIRKKPIDPEKEGMVHQIGFIILMLFVLVVTYNDIARIIRGENIIK